MKILLPVSCLFLFVLSGYCQSAEKQAFASSFKTASGGQHMRLHYSVGELAVKPISGTEYALLQGTAARTAENGMVLGTETLLAEAERIHIYPNPAEKFLVVEQEGASVAVIRDISGVQLLKENLQGKGLLNLDFLPQGLYLLEIQTKNGSKKTFKISKI